MTSISRRVAINATKAEVWAVLADFGNIYKTSRSIHSSRLTSVQSSGVGTTRECDMTMMNAKLFERVTAWEDEKRIEIDIYDWENMPGIKSMGATFAIEEIGDKTQLTATITYNMKWGPIGQSMDSMMMRSQNTKGWEQFLAGIKHHVETGRVVGKKTQLNTEPVLSAPVAG